MVFPLCWSRFDALTPVCLIVDDKVLWWFKWLQQSTDQSLRSNLLYLPYDESMPADILEGEPLTNKDSFVSSETVWTHFEQDRAIRLQRSNLLIVATIAACT
jgi:hypothetical protein